MAQPYRSRRILDLLKQKNRMTADDSEHGRYIPIAAATFAREAARNLKGHATAQSKKLRSLSLPSKVGRTISSGSARGAARGPDAPGAFVRRSSMEHSDRRRASVRLVQLRHYPGSNTHCPTERLLPSGFKTYTDLYLLVTRTRDKRSRRAWRR